MTTSLLTAAVAETTCRSGGAARPRIGQHKVRLTNGRLFSLSSPPASPPKGTNPGASVSTLVLYHSGSLYIEQEKGMEECLLIEFFMNNYINIDTKLAIN